MSWTEEQKKAVWKKADTIPGVDADVQRKDQCGATIKWAEHGNRDSKQGWEIDHIKPTSQGGTDDISNLRPLQWENNVATSDGRLTCSVTA